MQDIDDIIFISIRNLSTFNFNINSNDNSNAEMANIPLLKYQADNIPSFDGNSKQLNRFITSCEHFLTNFQNKTNVDDPINVCLIDTILNKLTGRAADLICSRSELNRWETIKNALDLSFSDQRGIDCLI